MKVKTLPSNSHELIYVIEGKEGFYTIAIHNTVLGNPLGGTRMMSYSNEQEAIDDAKRLSEGMTYKFGATNLSFGGGKATILPRTEDKKSILKEYAQVITKVNKDLISKKNRYFITGEDIGIGMNEVDILKSQTYPEYLIGSSSGSGDPSPFTAEGVYQALRACALNVYNSPKLKDKKVAIQGIGKVGSSLLEKIANEGAIILSDDTNKETVRKMQKKYFNSPNITIRSSQDSVLEEDVDILVPCAIGGTITKETLKKSSPSIVCGAANNQLDDNSTADFMHHHKITYAPDYIANAAGAIRVGVEALSKEGFNKELFKIEVDQIPFRTSYLIRTSKRENKDPVRIAEEMINQRIALSRIFHN